VAFSFFIIMGDGLPSGQLIPLPEKIMKTGTFQGRLFRITPQAPLTSEVPPGSSPARGRLQEGYGPTCID